MDEATYFEPAPNVAADIVEGEAILIRLEDGIYFSMNEVGSGVWRLLEAGVALEAMADLVSERCSVAKDVVDRDLRVFVDRLVELRLVLPSGARPVDTLPTFASVPYATPGIDIYEDMADLLALDPPAPGRGLKSLDPE